MKKRRGLANRGSSRRSRHLNVPVLERVEDRVLMALLTVNSTFDALNAVSGDGTLRGEILASNGTTTNNTIDFALPAGVQTITLKGPLPTIVTSLTVDGSSATGFTNKPLIQISGLNPSFEASGPAFTVNAGNSVLEDLIINNFSGDGVDINGGGDVVTGCWIGIDSTGNKGAGNTNDGILVTSANNTIGGILSPNPNVISNNGANQVEINGVNAGRNSLTNNYIGTNAAGTAPVPSSPASNGVAVESANNNIGSGNGFGFGALGSGNLISGNQEGLIFYPGANNNVAQGNFIGTDITGKLPIPNVDFGIYVTGGTKNTIGGLNSGNANVISANGNDGVRIQGPGSTANVLEGNFIGVGSDGSTPLGNGHWGVKVSNAPNNVIGGANLFTGFGFTGYGNTIENNDTLGGAGDVTILSATGDGILSNNIYQNGTGPGIDINQANAGTKAPILNSVQTGAGETEISGIYNGGIPGDIYRIQFFYSMTPNASGMGDGQVYVSNGDIDITADSQGSATINTTFSPSVPVGYYVSATATQGVLVTNNTSNFSTSVQTIQAQVSDLSVSTGAPAIGPLLDEPYVYTLTIANGGPNNSSDVILTDTLPKNSSVLSVSNGTVANGVLTADLGPLAAGGSDKVTIMVRPNAIGAFVNTAVVTGPNLDSNLTNNTSTTGVNPVINVVPDADLSVSLTPSTVLAPVGSPLVYTLAIQNSGPSVATGTMVTVQLPTDFTNVVVVPDQGSYTISQTNLITINTGIVPASSASIVTITATPTLVESAVANAGVTSPVSDPNPNNNTTSATVTVSNAADLALTLDASPNPVLVGQELVYTIVITNNGPSMASSPVVVDTLPAGFSYDAANSSAGPVGTLTLVNGTVSANFNTQLAVGDSQTITIAGIAATSGLLVNSATVGDPDVANPIEIDPDLTNNSASVTVPVSPADVSVSVVNPANPLVIGGYAVFQLQVQNAGPATATNVILTDAFSGAGNIVLASSGQFQGGIFADNLGTLASGQSETIYIVFDPTHSGMLIDNASITSEEYDPESSNNTSSSTNVVSPADVSVTVAGPTGPVLLGQPLIYVATVTNNGPTTATNVLFGNILPADSYFGALVASQGKVSPNPFYTQVAGDLGTLLPGASATVTIFVEPTVAETLTTFAAVSTDNLDLTPANNTASYSVSYVNLPGVVQFNSTFETVGENAGGINLLVQRTGGTFGAVSATYFTQGFTAVAGVNYVQTVGTVTFAAGQSYALITIPLLDDGIVDNNTGFFVGLESPTGGATIGPNAATGVIVVNTDRDFVPPTVASLLALPNGDQIDGFALVFSKAMDPSRASLVSNYFVFILPVGGNDIGTQVPLAAAQYNASNNTVILVPTAPLPANRFYEIVANGNYGTALTDLSGNLLTGSNGPVSNYVAFYGQGTQLVYNDAQGNQVTLNLSGGGILGVYLDAEGEAELLNLYAIVPHSTKLSGSVKKLTASATGHTFIGAINGFGNFGEVNSTLTTPGFFVGSTDVSALSIRSGTPVALTVSAESVTPKVSVAKASPKGPHKSKR